MVTATLGEHALLPTTVGLTIAAEWAKLGIRAATIIRDRFRAALEKAIGAVAIEAATCEVAESLRALLGCSERRPKSGVIVLKLFGD